jgi:hypothetical protein
LAAATNLSAQTPFAAPVIVQQSDVVVPQKQVVGSPSRTQVVRLSVMQESRFKHSIRSVGLVK